MKLSFLFFLFLSTYHFSLGQEKDKPIGAKSFALQSDISGAAANSVNLFTGDVALPLNLVSLPGRNGLDINVAISYSSNVQSLVSTWNLEAPTGILGLGWSMDIPKIITDHKQTGTREDDEYYLVEGGASSPLIHTTKGSDAGGAFNLYETKKYQFWKIKYYYDNIEMTGETTSGTGPNKWEITKEDGTVYTYGDKSGIGTIQWIVRWGNWIGSSSQITNQSQMAYIWNIFEIKNQWGAKLTFEYENEEQFVGSNAGKKHTEASYLKRIKDDLGRKVEFFYNLKATTYYQDAHVEKAEPDAYQEVYEKKFLDHIDVLRETGTKLFDVRFAYDQAVNTGTTKAKMLLTSITQYNAGGSALSGMKFSYYASGNINGYLQSITYPTGGTITYTYKSDGIALERCNRNLLINAPANYAEPGVWIGTDYVVVAWRALNADGGHDHGFKDVILRIYQWTGEWKLRLSESIGVVETLNEGGKNFSFKDIQVALEDNFFAVSYQNSSFIRTTIFYKSDGVLNGWKSHIKSNLQTQESRLLTGPNFVAIGGDQQYLTTLVFEGDSWKEYANSSITGNFSYTATNNYIIAHDRSPSLDNLYFYYLTEDKKWAGGLMPENATKSFASENLSYWHGSNSFALVMAEGNNEFLYRWGLNYRTFYKDDKLGGGFDDASLPRISANSLVSIGKSDINAFARFDGVQWNATTYPHASHTLRWSQGEDVLLFNPALSGYSKNLKIYDPNTNAWQSDKLIPSTSDFGRIGLGYYFTGADCYVRQPAGSWTKMFSLNDNLPNDFYNSPYGGFCDISFPQLNVISYVSQNYVSVYPLKNGALLNRFVLSNVRTYNKRTNSTTVKKYELEQFAANNTIVTAPIQYTSPIDVKQLQLNRLVNDEITGKLMDFPVTLITVNDGTQNTYTSFDYNVSTATADPSGNVAQYNEVTVIPRSSVVTSIPIGYTKTFFYNGLTATELGQPTLLVDLRWMGFPYETKVYNSANVLVSKSSTSLTSFTVNILNSEGTKVGLGYYARPTQSTSMVDGIETTTMQVYHVATGLVTESRTYDYDSKSNNAYFGNNFTFTRYKYFWEQYDPTRSKNILTPLIQTKQSVITGPSEKVVSISATTWKEWSGIFAPHKTYSWKRTGTGIFDFANWSGTGEPTADWKKLSEIDEIDTNGNPIQMTTR